MAGRHNHAKFHEEHVPSSLVPATLEITCPAVSVPAGFQCWQVAESNRKPHQTSQVQLPETQLFAFLLAHVQTSLLWRKRPDPVDTAQDPNRKLAFFRL